MNETKKKANNEINQTEFIEEIKKKKTHLLTAMENIRIKMYQTNEELSKIRTNDEATNIRTKHIIEGKKLFNDNPNVGIQYLIDHHITPNEALSIAEFLFTQDGISKKKLGKYLLMGDKMNNEILCEYMGLMQLSNMPILMALKKAFTAFVISGEGQKINRVLHYFSIVYHEQNSDIFSNAENCSCLCSTITYLNTNLHNPNVKDKLSVAKYIEMALGYDYPEDKLKSIYYDIKRQPMVGPSEESESFSKSIHVIKSGTLYKLGKMHKRWNKRWFVVSDYNLFYFRSENDNENTAAIPLEHVCIRKLQTQAKPYVFELYSEKNKVIKAVKNTPSGTVNSQHNSYKICSNSQKEINEWIEAISNSIQRANERRDSMVQRHSGSSYAKSRDDSSSHLTIE
ncbi:hypothetical protein A3Q56_02272 [Intoshia linei]|uniref:Cytohesin-1 n=1 Tax=Intoshia linei TaxID=1819745 RepID=A0A177B6J2_9BILA|nr:hypothetical protein A3Q56_02272 [Intoshia linei]